MYFWKNASKSFNMNTASELKFWRKYCMQEGMFDTQKMSMNMSQMQI